MFLKCSAQNTRFTHEKIAISRSSFYWTSLSALGPNFAVYCGLSEAPLDATWSSSGAQLGNFAASWLSRVASWEHCGIHLSFRRVIL